MISLGTLALLSLIAVIPALAGGLTGFFAGKSAGVAAANKHFAKQVSGAAVLSKSKRVVKK